MGSDAPDMGGSSRRGYGGFWSKYEGLFPRAKSLTPKWELATARVKRVSAGNGGASRVNEREATGLKGRVQDVELCTHGGERCSGAASLDSPGDREWLAERSGWWRATAHNPPKNGVSDGIARASRLPDIGRSGERERPRTCDAGEVAAPEVMRAARVGEESQLPSHSGWEIGSRQDGAVLKIW
jgi:hypothetical protein